MAKLYIVPTPIGNLEDISLRALRILKESDLILCEDTRITSKLLSHYEIVKPTIPYHKFNEHKQLASFIRSIQQHQSVAMVSDAGTPGISDPGFLLIRECIKENIEIECLPGATAFVPALVNSGLPCDRFYFYGFLPHKKGRQTALKFLSTVKETFVLYESPFRLIKTLEQLIEVCGSERKVCVSRELTKIYEENIRGSLAEVTAYFKQKTVKGEIVIIVEGNHQET
ncbi:MAG: 16S rRNA (cytidine(1402)-2'-O)-methyltransferase [Bacteroidales bacterium]|nr:16S rRNA (cytidine(1402)-2'-O)-methyltransferase [Bacteroidales bacterium]